MPAPKLGFTIAGGIIVARDATVILGPFRLFLKGLEYRSLDHLATGRIGGMRDVGIQLGAAIGIAGGPVLIKALSALVAKAGPQVVFTPALRAAVGQLAVGHGDKQALRPVNNLQIMDDEFTVERDRAAGPKPFSVLFFHELDANLGDDHGNSLGGRHPLWKKHGWEKNTSLSHYRVGMRNVNARRS